MKRLSNAKRWLAKWSPRIALLGLAITNPWSVGWIGAGIDTAVIYFTLYAVYVFGASMALAVGVIIYFMWANREPKAKIPSKSAKTQRAGKLIETN